jgi:hypothetical protein
MANATIRSPRLFTRAKPLWLHQSHTSAHDKKQARKLGFSQYAPQRKWPL